MLSLATASLRDTVKVAFNSFAFNFRSDPSVLIRKLKPKDEMESCAQAQCAYTAVYSGK